MSYKARIDKARYEFGELILTVPEDMRDFLNEFEPKKWTVELKRTRERRSLDANAYMWVLCQKIADCLCSTKEEVYRQAIRDKGVFTPILVEKSAAGAFVNQYCSMGLGNYARVDHDSRKNKGCVVIYAYKGTSQYDTKEMANLLDYIVEEAKTLGIPTETPDEIARLKAEW